MRRLVFLDYPADESRIEWQLENEQKDKFDIAGKESTLPQASEGSFSLVSGKKTICDLIEMLQGHNFSSRRLEALLSQLP